MKSLGIDIGSTTVKACLIDEQGEILYHRYRRHKSDIRGEMANLFREIAADLGESTAHVCLTGSAGLGAANAMNLPFCQEVVCGTTAVKREIPDADVVIELGGEDAKITFIRPTLSQRMNGTCAGGTGAFIDQMAALLQTDADGLADLAANAKTLYTIASRCGVFAKSDMQPLLNEGASHADLSASVLQAVVNQTIAGLACGQPIQGTVVFLGGPLTFMKPLRDAFERTLADAVKKFVLPANAEVFVAYGAALGRKGDPISLASLPARLEATGGFDADIPRLEPLFASETDRAAFFARHDRETAPRAEISQAKGSLFWGVDAGSTTLKTVLLDAQGKILHSAYMKNEGDPLGKVRGVLREIYETMPADAHIAGVCVTGYGEELLKTALCADMGEVETVCHTRAARQFAPDVSFILDIGGQDMKCLWIRDGVLDNVTLNEACSAGCGSFISTFGETLGLEIADFAAKAMESTAPVDLGTRCTVFMNSRVKQAQKEGADVADISCGLAYSVVRNALFKVIRFRDASQLGGTILCQGGTFLNNAVLRAFENITGATAIRPDIAGLMGAYGAALVAMDNGQWTMDNQDGGKRVSSVLPLERLQESAPTSVKTMTCKGCLNGCKLTISQFSGNRKMVSGFRCEKGAGTANRADCPNLMDEKYERLFSMPSTPAHLAPRGKIGIPRVLNIYENYPLWHAFLTALGFSVVLSRTSDHTLFEQGMATIPSESICYPAKLAHGHIQDLIDQGVPAIFYPSVTYEHEENAGANNYFNCPIVQSYPEVIDANMDTLKAVTFIKPFVSFRHYDKMTETLTDCFRPFGATRKQVRDALEVARREMAKFQAWLRRRGEAILQDLRKTGNPGIVLAGRPYHTDPEIHHGLPQMIASLGFAVLTEDSIAHLAPAERPLRVFDQWVYHSRLYNAAALVRSEPNLQLVQTNSFGCGLDAVTTDQVQEILQSAGKLYTTIKIDEISSLGAARIRLRSLKAALNSIDSVGAAFCRPQSSPDPGKQPYTYQRAVFTAAMRGAHTILAPQMSPVHMELVEAVFRGAGYNFHILEETTHEDIEVGLRYVNNDACYPTIVVVGQLMRAILSGKYDTENLSVMITQTGGGCRATNYAALIRRGLREVGLDHIPVVGLSVSGVEKNPGLKITPTMVHRAIKCIVLGDLLQLVLLRTRPYEVEPGAAVRLYEKWNILCKNALSGVKPFKFAALVHGIVDDFERLPLRDIARKPRVGVVGEILVKYHPGANNNIVGVIEDEGCEAVVPGLLGFFNYSFYNNIVKHDILGTSGWTANLMQTALRLLGLYENVVRRAFAKSIRFHGENPIEVLAAKASEVLSLAHQCGEGWLLTAEMIELIEHGCPNIVCAQPFACLPNHVTGKGMIRKLRELYPQSNIVPVDYDPGASEVNQLNRIKLMIETAMRQ